MQINMQESKRFFSSEKSQNPNLIRDIPQFITGFTYAEGCFNISAPLSLSLFQREREIFKDNTFKFGLHPQFITGFIDSEGSFMISAPLSLSLFQREREIFRNPKTRLG